MRETPLRGCAGDRSRTGRDRGGAAGRAVEAAIKTRPGVAAGASARSRGTRARPSTTPASCAATLAELGVRPP